MKVKWSIARLAILCLILFPFVVHAQTSAGKPKRSDKTKQDPAPSKKGKQKTDSTNDSSSRPAASPTPSRPVSSPTSDDATELVTARKERQDRIDAALKEAQAGVNDTDDGDLQQKLKQLTAEAHSLKHDIDHAASVQELTALDTKVTQFETSAAALAAPARSWTSILSFSNLLSVVPIVLGLVSLGGLVYLFSTFHARLDEVAVWRHNSLRVEQELRQSLKDNKEYAERIETNLSRVADDLGLRIDWAKRNSEEAKRLLRAREAQANTPEPLRAESTIEVPVEPTFPSLVADYLTRLRPSQPTALDADFRTNRLITAAAENAPFMFIADGDGSGAGIVLPRPRLQRSQEFSSYYKDYYYCSDPTAGEVFIIEPAVVRPDGNGWCLSQMGRMEIH